MRKILGFLACLLMLITAGNVLAAGYTCPTYKKYTSCKSGYYISNCPTSSSSWTGQTISSSSLTTGNSCKACPTGYTCSGGLVCPKAKTVTCSAGYYLPANATSCSACGGNRYWCPGGTFTVSSSTQGRNSVSSGYYSTGGTSTTRTGQSACGSNAYYCTGGVRNRVSSGYYSTGGTSTTRTGQSQCTGATYCSSGVKNNCPGSYTANTTAGKTSASQCQISCAAGTRVATKNGSCTTSSGAWFSSATTTNYGQVSLYNFCPKGFNSSSTSASGHDASTDCTISISGGKYISANNMQARYVKLWSSGNTTNTLTHVVEIQAFASSNGTGTNLLSGKGGTRGSNLTNATNGSWSRSAYASGTTGDLDLIWDMGSVQTVGSIKFAMYTDGRTYNDVQIALSTNGTTWTTVLGPVDIITQNLTTASPHLLVVAPSQQNSCPAGTAISSRTKALLSAAGSCSACTGRTKYSPAGASSCKTVSSGYYTTGCNTSGNNCTGQTQCTGATYCASGVKNNCPSGYTANTTAGKTSASQCQISCAAGARVATKNATCTSPAGNWISTATTTNYGKVSLVYYCPAGFFAPGNTAADHDEPTDCVISVSGGHYIPSNTMTARYIRMQSTGSPIYITEIQAFASSNGTGTNLLSGKGGTAGSNLTNATNNNWNPAVYASGTNLIWDIGSVQKIGSIKFALTGIVSTNVAEVVMYVSNDGQEWTLIMEPTTITPQYGVAQLSGELLFVAPSEELKCSAGTFGTARTKPLLNAADTCTKCTGATYSGAGAASCTNCPAQTSGWTRATGTGWTSYTSCYQTKSATSVSSYCSSGTLKQTATSSSAWGATTISSALSAKAGAYVNGQTCSQCTAGYYCTGGTTARKACSTLANGFYPNSAAGSDAATDCYTNNLSGQYVASAKATSATNCAAGTYKGEHKVNYGSTSSCSACTGATYSGAGASSCTSCPKATKYLDRVTSYSYWTSDGVHDDRYGCRAFIKEDDPNGNYTMSCSLSSTNEDYGVLGGSQHCMASGISSCIGGYYAPSGTSNTWAESVEALKGVVCVDAGKGYYSPEGNINRTQCPTGYTDGNAATAESGCKMSVDAGKYVASAKATSATPCANWTYKGSHTVNYGSTSSCTSCPTLTSGWTKATGTGWTSYTSCYQTKSGTAISSYCSSGTLKQTATSSTTWGATTISSALSAKAGAYVNGQTCSQCTSGYYCSGGTTARKACVIGSYSAAGASSCIACADGKTTSAAGSKSCNATCSNANDSEGDSAVKGWVDTTWNTNNTVSNLCKAASCLGGENGHYLDNGNCPRCDSFANGLYPRSSNSGTTKGQEACFLYTADIPGKYIASQRATSATLCQKGTYSAGSTSRVVHYGETSSCDGCPDNTYADEQGLTACKSCLENYTTYGAKTSPSACRILCQGGSYLASANATQCSNVGSGYWAPQAYVTQGNVGTRNRCATGLTTIGFGSGADEADDCGRVLHIGDGKLYLRSTKKTDLALNVNIGGTTYYGNMSTEDKFMSDGIEKSLKLNVNGTIYSVYDDSADAFFGGGETGISISPNLAATTIVPASYNNASGLSWSATLSDGTTVSGVGACDATTAENGDISADGFSPSGTGSGCWCKINSPAQGARYVYGTTNSSCSTKCGYFCANNMKGTSEKNITYRTNLYTTAGISVQ